MADLVNALDRACRCAPFFGDVLALHVAVSVFEKRNTGRPSLLRTPTDNARLVDVEIACTGSTSPFVFATIDEPVLEPIPSGIGTRAFGFDLLVDFFLALRESF